MASAVTFSGMLLLLASLTPPGDWWHINVAPWISLTLVGIGIAGEVGERVFKRTSPPPTNSNETGR